MFRKNVVDKPTSNYCFDHQKNRIFKCLLKQFIFSLFLISSGIFLKRFFDFNHFYIIYIFTHA